MTYRFTNWFKNEFTYYSLTDNSFISITPYYRSELLLDMTEEQLIEEMEYGRVVKNDIIKNYEDSILKE